MQTPPGNFESPPTVNYGGKATYDTDKIIGIILMVLSALGAIGALMLVLGGGILGAAGVQTHSALGAPTAVVGGAFAFLGIVLLLQCVLSFAVGFGIMGSKRWAFLTGLILYIIGTLLALFAFNILQLIISVGMAVYCYMRFSAKLGPAPIE